MNNYEMASVENTEPKMNTEVKNLLGKKFGRLLVQRFTGIDKRGNALWECLCDCGKSKIAHTGRLRMGGVKSCGCLRVEVARAKVLTHNMTHSQEFKIWSGIKNRTTNPHCWNYNDYGERGIGISEEWLNSFEAFYLDMGPRPRKDLSVERRDNNKGYSKENCYWATKREQARNRRNTVWLEYDGLKLSITEWAERKGLRRQTIVVRVRAKWSTHDILNVPEKRPRVFLRRGPEEEILP